MAQRARRIPLLYLLGATVALLGGSVTLWAQPPTRATGELPGSLQQAYGEAERLGEEPPGEDEGAEERQEASPWLDRVHLVGLAGGALMVTNLLVGLSIFLGARAGRTRFPIAKRKARRKWHYAVGLTGLSLATLHSLGRFVQEGEVDFGNPPAFLLGCSGILLALSGMVRAWPPRRLARFPRLWTWTHRSLVMAAVLLLAWHGIRPLVMFLLRQGG